MSKQIISWEQFRNLGKTSKHQHTPKGWGFEKTVVNNDKYCGKILYIAKGHKLSWHYHLVKDEVFYVQSGRVKLIYGTHDERVSKKVLLSNGQEVDSHVTKDEVILERGDSFHVPTGLRHQLIAQEDSEIFEFSTRHEDADSIRVEVGD